MFPTETFYALGCDVRTPEAVEAVVRLKQRTPEKGLPVIIGARSQLELLSPLFSRQSGPPQFDSELLQLTRALMDAFWPGPLSLVLPAAPDLPALVRGSVNGSTNTVAVRHTPHPQAAALCMECGFPLVATSANRSGLPSAARSEELDPLLLARTPVLHGSPEPGGGQPSTLLQPQRTADKGYACRILRLGAISEQALRSAGFPMPA